MYLEISVEDEATIRALAQSTTICQINVVRPSIAIVPSKLISWAVRGVHEI